MNREIAELVKLSPEEVYGPEQPEERPNGVEHSIAALAAFDGTSAECKAFKLRYRTDGYKISHTVSDQPHAIMKDDEEVPF